MAAPVTSPVNAGASTVPYLTVNEFKTRPHGLNLTTLVQGGDQGAQDQELARVLSAASRWADSVCGQSLAATRYVTADRVRVDSDGLLNLETLSQPVQRLLDVATGPTVASLTSMPDLSGAWIDDTYLIRVPVTGGASTAVPALGVGFLANRGPRARLWVRFTYESGYPITVLTAPAAAGATSVTVADGTGIIPGTQLRIGGSARSQETVTVAATYTAGSLVVPITAALGQPHAVGDFATALPDDAKDAVALAASAFIKERGSDSLVMQGTRSVRRETQSSVNEFGDLTRAAAMLAPYRRFAVGQS